MKPQHKQIQPKFPYSLFKEKTLFYLFCPSPDVVLYSYGIDFDFISITYEGVFSLNLIYRFTWSG